MPSRPLKAAVAVAIAGAFCLTATPAQAAPDPEDLWLDLTPTYTSTAIYAYEPWAPEEGGYARTDECVPEMGYHYVNPEYLGSLDPTTPAALLYEGGADRGARRLVAVEWVVPDTGQATAPELFGETFYKDTTLKAYTLHAWIHKDNPDGLFTAFNPEVKCPVQPTPTG
ncbi:hypothetical protein [Streptomyces sp. RG80]|uniref:hypothetical protein n=1 Tax=Streptomyces sp. RG80 TaxID=3157340 RepID=UPI00338EE6FA